MTWQFCPGCRRKQPAPECPLCERLNGRPMTPGELDALADANREDNARGLAEDWILDVPFDDGTTPRQRRDDAAADLR